MMAVILSISTKYIFYMMSCISVLTERVVSKGHMIPGPNEFSTGITGRNPESVRLPIGQCLTK